MNGFLALSALELQAWAAMTGNLVRPEEWDALREMDTAFLDAVHARHREPNRSSGELSPQLFDAMFE